MATTITSGSVKDYIDGDRTRTLNHRGSLLSTVSSTSNYWASSDDGSIWRFAMIPFFSCIRRIIVSFSADVTELAFKIGIGYTNADKTMTEIKDDLVTVPAPAATLPANTERSIWPGSMWTRSIYRHLSEEIPGTSPAKFRPIEAFEPYCKERYGVLYFKSTTKNTNAVNVSRVMVDFVEISPSETPLIDTYVSAVRY